MFSFLNDVGNYADRRVARDDFDWGFISTARVSDGRKPYETAVEHPEYNDGKMVIVDCYDTKADAAAGHAKWKKRMTAKRLPASLTDVANAEVAQMLESIDGGKMTFPRKAS